MKNIRQYSWIILPQGKTHGLCLSGIHLPRDPKLIKDLDIGAIVSISPQQTDISIQSRIVRYVINVQDQTSTNLLYYFSDVGKFIHENRKKTNVLVHCMAGISRSATIVISYLMKYYRYEQNKIISMKQARNIVQQKRQIICPNDGFLQQLRQYEEILNEQNKKNKTSCKLI